MAIHKEIRTEAAVDEYGFKRGYIDLWGDGGRERRDEHTLITSGNWAMVIKSLPVVEYEAPQLYGIYWAVPFVRLVEEEREIIWALMLEGLTEQQACEEYFLTHHTDYQNTEICYLPTPEILAEAMAVFGER